MADEKIVAETIYCVDIVLKHNPKKRTEINFTIYQVHECKDLLRRSLKAPL